MRNLILVICTIQLVYGAPQMITFKDGKVGVNFAGYSASAGLGGLLTGDASHGFLSASAGTPNGQHASAGLGGDLNNQASGIAYANAQATPNKKTGVVLSGSTSGKHDVHVTIPSNSNEIVTENVPVSVIQRIKPPKKYHLLKPQQEQQQELTNDAPATTFIAAKTKTVATTSHSSPPVVVVNKRHDRLEHSLSRKQQRRLLRAKLYQQQLEQRIQQQLQHPQHPQEQGHSDDVRHEVSQPSTVITKTKLKTLSFQPAPIPTSQSAENEGKTVYTKSFSKSAHAVPSHPTEDYPNQGPVIQPSIVQRALGIPIGILQSLQQSLSGLGHAQKTVSFSHY